MTKVLFIYPSMAWESKEIFSAFAPPMGALYLASVLEHSKLDVDVSVWDLASEPVGRKEFIKKILDLNPEVVCITCLTFNFDMVKEVCEIIKRELPECYIGVGGAHVSILPKESINALKCDSIAVGEGESRIVEVVRDRPKGIIYCEDSDFNSLPFPDRKHIRSIKYGKMFDMNFGVDCTTIFFSRGCPFNCAFCARPKKQMFRMRKVSDIIAELKEIANMGYDSVAVGDDNFTTSTGYTTKIAKAVHKNKLHKDFFFFGQGRVDRDSADMYYWLRRMNVVGMSYGIESVAPKTLEFYNKTHEPTRWKEKIKNTYKLAVDAGIIINSSLIAGAPMDTKETIEESIAFVDKQETEGITLNLLSYMVGTKLWDDAVNNGKIAKDDYWTDAIQTGLTDLTPEDLRDYQKMIYAGLGWRVLGRVPLKWIKAKRGRFLLTMSWKAKQFLNRSTFEALKDRSRLYDGFNRDFSEMKRS